MPNVATNGSACTTGHGCDTTTTINGGSTDVLIGTQGVARKDDPLASHTIPNNANPPVCVSHPNQKVNVGLNSVLVNNRPIAVVGNSVDIGGQITQGSNTVVAGSQ